MSSLLNRGLVLVVEDLPASRWLVERILGQAGFETHSVTNGAEALEYLHSFPEPSVIVLDISMPIMNGWEFLHHQMADTSLALIPVILYSGDPFVTQAQLDGTNVVAFVPKADTDTRLLPAVEEAVEKRKTA